MPASTIVEDLLHVLPLVSAILWLGIGIWPLLRRRFFSPFERSLTIFALLIGLWAFLDWIFLGTTDANLAILISNVRISMFTLAMLALLLATVWIYLGHSRYDVLLALPVLGSLAIIWTGLTRGVEFVSWGPRLIRDSMIYALWAIQQIAYLTTSIVLTLALYFKRKDLPFRIRGRVFWTSGSLLTILAFGVTTNMYNNVTQTAGVPWLSSLLIVPASIILVALVPLSSEELGELFRAVSAVDQRVIATYLFYKTGEPLVALSSSRSFPIEAEQLEGVLAVVGNFVETSVSAAKGYGVTAMRYDRLGILAVRGQYVIAAAVYDGAAYDALRSELVRIVRNLEQKRGQQLQTWEDATKSAEAVAEDFSSLLYRPRKTEFSKEPVGKASVPHLAGDSFRR
ncbi:MAG: hypothetical protein WC985_10920 [Thermoplasmata archaeon]